MFSETGTGAYESYLKVHTTITQSAQAHVLGRLGLGEHSVIQFIFHNNWNMSHWASLTQCTKQPTKR